MSAIKPSSSSASSSTPDYSDPGFCSALMNDHWVTGDDNESAEVCRG
jgi:hypothetical protein